LNDEANQVEDPQRLREDISRQKDDVEKLRMVVNGEMQVDEDEEIYSLLGNYDTEEEALQTQKNILDDLNEK
jgi:hypothetical protein